jgi:hypothetical protein
MQQASQRADDQAAHDERDDEPEHALHVPGRHRQKR